MRIIINISSRLFFIFFYKKLATKYIRGQTLRIHVSAPHNHDYQA